MKARPLSAIAVAAARRILDEAPVVQPCDIQVEALAHRHGMLVLYGRMTTAEATLVRAGTHAVVRINERSRGTARERYTTAHELGHFKLHKAADHFKQCETGSESGDRGAYWLERDADEFAAELLMPELLAAPLCVAAHPTLEDVDRIARTFRTSFESSGIRYVQLARGPCAFVMTRNGRVKWATESKTFPGRIVRGRMVDPGSAAARARKRVGVVTREVPGKIWGAPEGALVEEAVSVGGGGVLSWVTLRA